MILTGKINVLEIDKDRLFKGKKGTYLDIIIIPTPNSPYHDYMIKQRTKKDEEGIILGDASEYIPEEKDNQPNDPAPPDEEALDLPF
ncbi:hypothetical protein H8E88_07840 [candidate division KSB1 bacterium]|nr:hypothetical protein [candidate division KSB1 bacterium]